MGPDVEKYGEFQSPRRVSGSRHDRLVSCHELKVISDLTVQLTEIRQKGCSHLSVEDFAPDVFHSLLSRLAMFRNGTLLYSTDLFADIEQLPEILKGN